MKQGFIIGVYLLYSYGVSFTGVQEWETGDINIRRNSQISMDNTKGHYFGKQIKWEFTVATGKSRQLILSGKKKYRF